MRRDALFSALAVFGRCVEVVDRLGVFEREAVDDLVGAVGVFLVEVVGYFDKGVGRAGHGGEDDDAWLVAGGNEACHVFDPFSGADGGASEFQYVHVGNVLGGLGSDDVS